MDEREMKMKTTIAILAAIVLSAYAGTPKNSASLDDAGGIVREGKARFQDGWRTLRRDGTKEHTTQTLPDIGETL